MIVAIIAGGEKSRFRRIDEADFIIACDKGAQYAAEEGVVPDLTAGDFDSVPKGFRPVGETAVLPTEKNDTDTMFAVRKALSRGCDQIYLYCAEGGRPDHFLGNIQAALFAAENMGIEEIMPDDAGQNISMGAWYLAYLAEKFGDERAVIAAYNAGENTVSGWLARGAMPDDIPYAETKNYVGRVEFFKKVYAALYK